MCCLDGRNVCYFSAAPRVDTLKNCHVCFGVLSHMEIDHDISAGALQVLTFSYFFTPQPILKHTNDFKCCSCYTTQPDHFLSLPTLCPRTNLPLWKPIVHQNILIQAKAKARPVAVSFGAAVQAKRISITVACIQVLDICYIPIRWVVPTNPFFSKL